MNLGQHTSQKYNQELEEIRNKVLQMGGVVESQVENAIKALLERDVDLSEEVATSDYKVNKLEVDIDEECTQIIARRQPAARDLRLVMTVVKVITDLERTGDEAEQIATYASSLSSEDAFHSMHSELSHLGSLVLEMLHDALDAFARMDAEEALGVVARKKKLRAEFDALSRLSITHMMEEPRNIKGALPITWCARSLGRIGDHAMNISEYVIYLVKGKDVRHISYKKIRDKILNEKD